MVGEGSRRSGGSPRSGGWGGCSRWLMHLDALLVSLLLLLGWWLLLLWQPLLLRG